MIKNVSKVAYKIDDHVNFSNSNIICTTKINPIIIFKKCIDEKEVKIFIYNNSNTILKNTCFFENFKNIENKIIYIDCHPYEVLECGGVSLGDIKENEKIEISYMLKEKCVTSTLLSYELSINEKSIFYLKNY